MGCEARDVMKRYKFCNVHEKEPLKFFCEKCNVLFCPLCIVDHSGHKFIEQKFSAEAYKRKTSSLKSKLKEKIKYLTNFHSKVNEEILGLKIKTREEREKFETFLSTFLDTVKLKQKDLREDLNSKYQHEEEMINNLIEKYKESLDDLKNQSLHIKKIEEMLKSFLKRQKRGSKINKKTF